MSGRAVLLCGLVSVFLLAAPVMGASVLDPFDAENANWNYASSYSYSAVPGKLKFQPGNLVEGVRITSTFELLGDFEIRLVGEVFWQGSYLGTHVKHWAGVYQSGSPTPTTPDPRLFIGFNDAGEVFPSDMHYHVDFNALLGPESGVTKSYDVKWVRSGQTITTYYWNGTQYVAIDVYTIQQPNQPLYFELVEGDGTSYGSGYSAYDLFSYQGIAVPEPGRMAWVSLAVGGVLSVLRRRKRRYA